MGGAASVGSNDNPFLRTPAGSQQTPEQDLLRDKGPAAQLAQLARKGRAQFFPPQKQAFASIAPVRSPNLTSAVPPASRSKLGG
jgi:hypothetical protein